MKCWGLCTLRSDVAREETRTPQRFNRDHDGRDPTWRLSLLQAAEVQSPSPQVEAPEPAVRRRMRRARGIFVHGPPELDSTDPPRADREAAEDGSARPPRRIASHLDDPEACRT